jgi:hypothetical protein
VRRFFLSAAAALAVLFAPSVARADVTSWLAIGSGYGVQRSTPANRTDRAVTMTYSIGVGSSPRADWVVGGILRATSFLSLGTDLGLAARVATGGFARGQWGLALDAGIVGRWWKDGDYGDYPFRFILTGGAPWGLQIGLGADVLSMTGGTPATGFFGVIEIDLLRLTVMRQGATDAWWRNPSPAGGRRAE